MIKLILTSLFLVSGLPAHGAELLYSCTLEDQWLKDRKWSGQIDIQNLDQATLKIQSSSETVTCPLAVESVQDLSQGRIAQVTFRLVSEACSPGEKSFNRNLRKRLSLIVDAHPASKGKAQLSWRNKGKRADCQEKINNLRSHGIGNKFHPAAQNAGSADQGKIGIK